MPATLERPGMARQPRSVRDGEQPASEPDIVIRATGLTKRYGSQTAIRDVSFEVRRGEVFGFLGPNGSGKSTTIGIMLGLIEPTAGAVDLFGLGSQQRSSALSRVGAIIESPAFYPYLSGYDNLQILGALRGRVRRTRILSVLKQVGLQQAGNKRFGQYSLGMKQRLGIAWTLLHDPELIILDEPTNGLDPAGMLEVRHLILELAAEGKTIFLSSHLLNEVEQVCDRVAIIQHGQVLVEGPISSLVKSGDQFMVRTRDLDRASEVLRRIPSATIDVSAPNRITVQAPESPAWRVNQLLVEAGVRVDELREVTPTLEQTFLELTAEKEHGL